MIPSIHPQLVIPEHSLLLQKFVNCCITAQKTRLKCSKISQAIYAQTEIIEKLIKAIKLNVIDNIVDFFLYLLFKN